MHSDEILSYADKYMSGGGNAHSGKSSGSKGLSAGVKGAAAVGTKNSSAAAAKGSASGGMSSTRRRIPADLPEKMSDEIRRMASETFRVLSCDGVARVDFILEGGNDKDGSKNTPKIYVNEINAIPGSLSFYLWEATGVPFAELLDRLVSGALKRDRDKSHKTISYPANIFAMGAGITTPGPKTKS